MNRWTRTRSPSTQKIRLATFSVARLALLALTLGCFTSQIGAQTGVREFPAAAVRGVLVVTQPPNIQMDRNPDRLSPGARIRGPNNLLVMSGAIVGQEIIVNYVRDGLGLVHEVWILTPAEVSARRPNMRESYLSGTDVNKPPTDDGRTPYDQLPRFGAQPPAAPAPTPNQ
jgi:hypothetical protein